MHKNINVRFRFKGLKYSGVL